MHAVPERINDLIDTAGVQPARVPRNRVSRVNRLSSKHGPGHYMHRYLFIFNFVCQRYKPIHCGQLDILLRHDASSTLGLVYQALREFFGHAANFVVAGDPLM